MADVHELVGDAYAAGEEEDGAIAVERFVAAIGAFDEAAEGNDLVGGFRREIVELSCHARLSADD